MEVLDLLMTIVGSVAALSIIIAIAKIKSNPKQIEEQYKESPESSNIFVKKYKEATVEHYKEPIVKLGIIAVLSILIMAFNVSGDQLGEHIEKVTFDDRDYILEMDAPNSQHTVVKVAPPEIKPENPIIKIIDIEPPALKEPIEKEPIIDEPVDDQPLVFNAPKVDLTIPDIVLVEEDKEEPFHIFVEEMPEFPGGEKALAKFLSKNIKYPPIAQENGIDGRVVVRFVVHETGNIGNVEILRDIGGGCGAEASRVVNKMPKWKVGRQRGKAVKVYYSLPVNFTLHD